MNRRYSKFVNVMVVFGRYSDEDSKKVQEHARYSGLSSADMEIKSCIK